VTTYRAIGKYAVDATRDEKERALRQALDEAAIELIDLGLTLHSVEGFLKDAMMAAEEKAMQLAIAPVAFHTEPHRGDS
jgi:hypothetical protein